MPSASALSAKRWGWLMSKAEQMQRDMQKRMNGTTKGDVLETGEDANLLAKLQALRQQSKPQQQLALLQNEIRVGAFVWKPTGLLIDGEATETDWREVGRLLKMLDSSMQWLIGDLIVCGEDLRYGDQKQIAEAFGFEYATIRDFAYVSRNVEMSVRTDKLDFGHHKLVAAMPLEEQADWLQAAAEGDNGKRWSIARLRQEIDAAKLGHSASVPPRTLWYRAAARERERVRKAFERSRKKGNNFELKNHIEFAKEQGQYWQKFAQELEEEIKKGN